MKTKSMIAGSAFATILAFAHTAEAGLLSGAGGGFAGGLSGGLGGMSRHAGFATSGDLTGRGSLDMHPAARAAKATKSAASSTAEAGGGLANSVDLNGGKNSVDATTSGTTQAAANTAKPSTEKPAAATPAQSTVQSPAHPGSALQLSGTNDAAFTTAGRQASADSSTDVAAQHTRETNSAKGSGSGELSASQK